MNILGLNDSLQIASLKNRLKKVSTTTGNGVARAFLKSQAALFGSYRNALQIVAVSASDDTWDNTINTVFI